MVAEKYEHSSLLGGITVGMLLMAIITRRSHCEPKKFILSIILRGGKHTHTHTHMHTQVIHEPTHHSVPESSRASVLGDCTQATHKASQ